MSAAVHIPASLDPHRIAQYERMVKTLLASMGGNVDLLARYLSGVEATSPDRKKRELARALMQYVFDRKYLVNRA